MHKIRIFAIAKYTKANACAFHLYFIFNKTEEDFADYLYIIYKILFLFAILFT